MEEMRTRRQTSHVYLVTIFALYHWDPNIRKMLLMDNWKEEADEEDPLLVILAVTTEHFLNFIRMKMCKA
ncbi:hypothetical protein CMV_003900 [Castanea mollissima]|uniref:Uncharacterized protein n=1 Tax=Castanea mollissima TaxID=60419 RepID=A0A8J4RGK8_9ROSI|nr:hypothetical protein CMV_003900 [Castanea mollissima]